MWIGTQKIDGVLKWSKFNGKFWTGYVAAIMGVDNDKLRSSRQDYVPVMTLQLHRWNDDSRD